MLVRLHPVLEEKLYETGILRETQGRRESRNDKGKTRRRKRFFCQFFTWSFILSLAPTGCLGFQRVQNWLTNSSSRALLMHVGMFLQPRQHIDEYNQCLILPFRANFQTRQASRHVTKNFCLTCVFVSV